MYQTRKFVEHIEALAYVPDLPGGGGGAADLPDVDGDPVVVVAVVVVAAGHAVADVAAVVRRPEHGVALASHQVVVHAARGCEVVLAPHLTQR